MTEALLEKEIEKVRHSDTVEALEEKFKDGMKFAKKIGKTSTDAAEEFLEDTTRHIKRHPAGAVAGAFGIGILVGGLVVFLIKRK